MPGARPVGRAGQLPRPPRAELRLDRSGHQADVPGQHQHRHRVPARPDDGLRRALRPQQPRADDRGHRRARRARQRGLHHRQPRRGRSATIQSPSGATPLGQPMPKPKRQYDALELTLSRRFANNCFWSASYVYSRLYGNYVGPRELRRNHARRRPTSRSATAQQQAGSIARPGGNANRAWDIDELLLGFARHPRRRSAACRPIVRTSSSCTARTRSPFGTQVGANFYGGSGTPLTTYVVTTNQTNVFVERPRRHGPDARADADRPAGLARAEARRRQQAPPLRAERAQRSSTRRRRGTSSTT